MMLRFPLPEDPDRLAELQARYRYCWAVAGNLVLVVLFLAAAGCIARIPR